MNDDDFIIDDLIANLNKTEKKRMNSGRKGKSGERELCKLFTARFKDSFFRVVGSGNRWSQVELTEHAKGVLTADIVCPPKFKFSVECKYGYADIRLENVIAGGDRQLDEFLTKTQRDADSVSKSPMLCWRKPRHPWLSFTKIGQLNDPCLIYKGWTVVDLTRVLELPDSFFYD